MFFITSTNLLRFSIFSCVSRGLVITCWSIFMTTALQSLSQIRTSNSSLWWYQLITFFQDEIFLVSGIMSEFLLYPWYFGYYVKRLLILLKSSILVAVNLFLECRFWPAFMYYSSSFSFQSVGLLHSLALLGLLLIPPGASCSSRRCFSGTPVVLGNQELLNLVSSLFWVEGPEIQGFADTDPACGLACHCPGYGVGAGALHRLLLSWSFSQRKQVFLFLYVCVYALGRSVLQAFLVTNLEYMGDKKENPVELTTVSSSSSEVPS